MASTGPLLNALDLSLGVLERLAQRARVALVRALDRHRHDRPRRQVHGLLGFVGQMGTTILHFGDLRVRIRRTLPFLVRAFLLAPPIQPRQRLPRGRANARRLRQTLQELLVGLSGIPTHDAPHRRVRFPASSRRSQSSFPLRRPVCARRSWIQVNTSRWVSKSISRRVARSSKGSGPAPPTQAPGSSAPQASPLHATPSHARSPGPRSTPPARAKVASRGQARTPQNRRIEPAASRFHESVEALGLQRFYSNANRKDAQGSAADRSSAPQRLLTFLMFAHRHARTLRPCTCHVRPAQRALSPRTASVSRLSRRNLVNDPG